MTREEFNKGWKKGMRVQRNGLIHEVVTVDFEEDLIGFFFDEEDKESGTVTWARFENCEIVKR